MVLEWKFICVGRARTFPKWHPEGPRPPSKTTLTVPEPSRQIQAPLDKKSVSQWQCKFLVFCL